MGLGTGAHSRGKYPVPFVLVFDGAGEKLLFLFPAAGGNSSDLASALASPGRTGVARYASCGRSAFFFGHARIPGRVPAVFPGAAIYAGSVLYPAACFADLSVVGLLVLRLSQMLFAHHR